ncbi:hypothetical protein [Tahibacter amnicola]|uniref:Uncharacterized protein n=1 Tax=Tahibacter amnicola TaxID=2976241 RepID=A0ABY6BG50_9GAMM|nr:hypothetical protein [Tahibacter amnicola]UXI68581.1 hypothetical protein N4264_02705 [Tahibacter amnicola]
MGVAYYIVLDTDAPGFDASVDGKTVGKGQPLLDTLARTQGLPDLMQFLCVDDDDESADLAEGLDLPDDSQWHDSAEGQQYFARLAIALRQQADAGRHADLIAELDDFAVVLQKAQSIGARWRLGMDI